MEELLQENIERTIRLDSAINNGMRGRIIRIERMLYALIGLGSGIGVEAVTNFIK